MTSLRAPFMFVTLAALVLSGCVGGDDSGQLDDDNSSDSDVVVDAELADGGSIVGLVFNEELLPISGAQVGILSLEVSGTTDDDGAFAFRNVAPGSYQLLVNALGYEATSQRVEVAANAEALVEVSLVRIPVEEVYHDVFGPLRGQFSCQVGTPTLIQNCVGAANSQVFPNDVTFVRFQLSAQHWRSMVGEAEWDQGTAATGTGLALYPSYEGRDSSHWWCEADGNSPIFFRYDREGEASQCTSQGQTDPPVEDVGDKLLAAADPGFPGLTDVPPVRLVIQQKYDVYITMFYGDLPPDGYSARPDA